MNERNLHFWVGLFCMIVMVIIGGMVFQFGKLGQYFRPTYVVSVHFEETPGLFAPSPVLMNGIAIGFVREVKLDEKRGGVLVLVDIEEQYKIRSDSEVHLRKSLLGDSSLEFTPGVNPDWIEPGSLLAGFPPVDPFEIVNDMQSEVTKTLRTFNETSQEWRTVAAQLNSLLDTNEGNLDQILESSAVALTEFTVTMKKANHTLGVAESLLADPGIQANLKQTIAALPKLADETSQTIAAVKVTVEKINSAAGKIDANLETLNEATLPLARQSKSIVIRLDNTLANLQSLTGELNTFAKLVNKEEGSLQMFASDPELYNNLNRSAMQFAVLLKNAEPLMRDLRIFSDKVARHPELIGVSGALKGSSGIKDEEEFEQSPEERTTRRPGIFPR
ncbi:MAG TPA: MlaD family protein [Planctomycetaceae bacterium]|nr:MlaD family protein [Planctomycetaceae bacterium]